MQKIRTALTAVGLVAAATAIAIPTASADERADTTSSRIVSTTGATPPGCSMWTDYKYGHGRGLLYCNGSGRDVQVTVRCGNGSVTRTERGYEHAIANCPAGLGAIAVSGKYR